MMFGEEIGESIENCVSEFAGRKEYIIIHTPTSLLLFYILCSLAPTFSSEALKLSSSQILP